MIGVELGDQDIFQISFRRNCSVVIFDISWCWCHFDDLATNQANIFDPPCSQNGINPIETKAQTEDRNVGLEK